jgi:hypothetical protein
VLGIAAGGAPVDGAQLHRSLAGLEDALQELLLAFPRDPDPALAAAHATVNTE